MSIDVAHVPPRPDLPHALHDRDALEQALGSRRPLVFLDYDGTLTPIVSRPDAATMNSAMRTAVRQLAERHPVAVVSGRQLEDVRDRVGLPELYYAGDHGFVIAGPPGSGIAWEFGSEYVDEVAAMHRQLATRLPPIDGLILEHKRYSVSVHYRLVADDELPDLERAVTAAVDGHPRLQLRPGKRIFEIRPVTDWHKGKAVRKLMELFDDGPTVPIFVGDDITDEDAFREIRDTGFGIIVGNVDRPTAAAFYVRDTTEVGLLLDYLSNRTA